MPKEKSSAARYGLKKISVGLYEHRTGVVIVRTEGWEGPRSRNLVRWEHGEIQADGAVLVGSPSVNGILYRTLRKAAAALDEAANDGQL